MCYHLVGRHQGCCSTTHRTTLGTKRDPTNISRADTEKPWGFLGQRVMMLRTTWGWGWTCGAQVAGERSGQAGLTGNLNHSSIQPLERERGEVYRRVCVHSCVHVCVCVCVCMHVVFVHVYVCARMSICGYMCGYVCACVHVCAFGACVYVCMYIYMHVCVHVRVYVNVCKCVYMCMCECVSACARCWAFGKSACFSLCLCSQAATYNVFKYIQ